ncbi:MAG: site-specific integrase [Acidobacteriia bacterium]|jgi:site-specific recombinase XerD|nr:site-specific integrase [Terriglobia bacterium]
MSEYHRLGPYVRQFLLQDLIADRNLSRNTQRSYRDTIRLLLRFIDQQHSTDPTQVTVEQVNADLVRSFLTYLEQNRTNSVATRNQRLAAIHSFCRFIARQVPELLDQVREIQSIPLRRSVVPCIAYLEKEEIDIVLATPDRSRPQGQRDYALLLFLYNTGARADEAAHTTLGDLNLGPHPSVRIFGKGGKTRLCPLWSHTSKILRNMLGPRLDGSREAPLFRNVRGQPMTRFGIHTLVKRTAAKAAQTVPSLREKRATPHTIRHTTAVHLLRSGVDINTIRAWLGHVSLETTNRYAQVDLEMKAKALETCAISQADPSPERTRIWRKDPDLLAFLNSL